MAERAYGRRTVLRTSTASLCPLVASSASARDGHGPPDEPGPPEGRGGRLPPRGAAGPAVANRPDAAIGVVDRIVDGRFVVILIEDDGEVTDQIVLEVGDPRLPPVAEGDVLLVGFDDGGEVVEIRRLDDETDRRRRRARQRFEELAEGLSEG